MYDASSIREDHCDTPWLNLSSALVADVAPREDRCDTPWLNLSTALVVDGAGTVYIHCKAGRGPSAPPLRSGRACGNPGT